MLIEQELFDEILKCCLEIHQDLGPGLLEKVYRNGVFYELRDRGLMVYSEKNYKVFRKQKSLKENTGRLLCRFGC